MQQPESGPRPAKRLRTSEPAPPPSPLPAAAAADALAGWSAMKVFVPATGIPFGGTRVKIWRAAVEGRGGALTQDAKAGHITHVVVGDKGVSSLPLQLRPPPTPPPPPQPQPQPPQPQQQQRQAGSSAGPAGPAAFVSPEWLEQSLAQGQPLPAAGFPPPEEPEVLTPVAGGRSSRQGSCPSVREGARPGSRESIRSGSTQRRQGGVDADDRRRWLGEDMWHEGCATMGAVELMLQGVFSEERSRQIGNEPLVQALSELSKYEGALAADSKLEGGVELGSERGEINERALQYARAAASVRACAYRLCPPVRAHQLPFVAESTADKICQILETGTCAPLEFFRADQPVRDSRGRVRPDSAGGATRARFCKLPGVAQKTAERWWQLGLRSFDDVERAAQPGGPLAEGGEAPIGTEARFSLEHREDLLEGTRREEVLEMMAAVQAGVQAVTGAAEGWKVEVVGGGRRSQAAHDADFCVTHPSVPLEGVLLQLRGHLVREGRLFPPGEAMFRTQHGRMPTHIERLRHEHLRRLSSGTPSRRTLDRFDRLHAIYRTAAGRACRIDVIFVPPDEWAFGFLGWVGSKTFLRHMRRLADDRGMFLNSHRLFAVQDGQSVMVPDEAPPRHAGGKPHWPPGWAPGRRVEHERDIFELLGLPYREPHKRDMPG